MKNAFVQALDAEVQGACWDMLVSGYEWANSTRYGPNPDLRRRAEEWAQRVIDSGHTAAALEALANAYEP